MMKTINDSALFSEVISKQSILKSIKEVDIDNDSIKLSQVADAINIINKKLNFPTKQAVVNGLNQNTIKLIYNPEEISMPKYMNVFGKLVMGKPVVLVDISKYAGGKRDGDITIFPKTLFALIQNAAISLELLKHWNKYMMNNTILKNLCISYARLMGKVLDKMFAINIDTMTSDTVNFFLAKFFLINMCGKGNDETTNNLAYNACFNKSSLALILETEKSFDEPFKNIFNLFEAFTHIRGLEQIQIRSFVENWVRMYGDSTLLAIDYIGSFLSMTFSTVVKGNLNKEFIIGNVAEKFINKAFIEFSRLMK